MTYLPEDFLHQTTFPTAYGKDARLQVRMISEQWRRMYPRLSYFCLERSVQAAVDAPAEVFDPIGDVANTQWDPLYGEAIDPTIAATGAWAQPHGDNVAGNALDVEVFAAPVSIHGRVQREAREYDLKKYGFDEMRDIIVTFAVSQLDQFGVTVFAGDEFVWDGDRYIIKQHKSSGYWKNTNLRFFRVCNCEQVRSGS